MTDADTEITTDKIKKNRKQNTIIFFIILIVLTAVGMFLIKQQGKAEDTVTNFVCQCTNNQCQAEFISDSMVASIQYDAYVAEPAQNPTELVAGTYQHRINFSISDALKTKPFKITVITGGEKYDNPDWNCVINTPPNQSVSPTVALIIEPTITSSQFIEDEEIENEIESVQGLQQTSEIDRIVREFYLANPNATVSECVAGTAPDGSGGGGGNVMMCILYNPARSLTPASSTGSN